MRAAEITYAALIKILTLSHRTGGAEECRLQSPLSAAGYVCAVPGDLLNGRLQLWVKDLLGSAECPRKD